MTVTNHNQNTKKSFQSPLDEGDFYEENSNNFNEISELIGYTPQCQRWSDGDDE
jgi:hypothetical protein